MLRIHESRPAKVFKNCLSNYWGNRTNNLKRAADNVNGSAEEKPPTTLRRCDFPYQYSKTDLIEYSKTIIQDHLAAE